MSATVTENFVLNKMKVADFIESDVKDTILLQSVSWKEYEFFLEEFRRRPSRRLAYSNEELEIKSQNFEEAAISSFICFVVSVCCEFVDFDCESYGATTFKKKSLKKGVEPDECFYIQSAKKVIGKRFKAENIPMPDVVVELDVISNSLDKFPIYSALKVPEVWIYDGKKVSFNKLKGKKYHQISHSVALPLLSAEKLTEYLKLSQEKGQTFALKAFRQHLNDLKVQ